MTRFFARMISLFRASANPTCKGMANPDDSLHASFSRLSKYEGLYFIGHEEDQATFTRAPDFFPDRFPYPFVISRSAFPRLIDLIQRDRDYFAEESSRNEMTAIPAGIKFHPWSKDFSEHTFIEPPKGEATGSYAFENEEGWIATKKWVETDTIVQAYDFILKELKKAEAAIAGPRLRVISSKSS